MPTGLRIYLVVSIQYLSLYKCDNDPFKRIPLPPGLLAYNEYLHDSDNEEEVWEIERIVDYALKTGKRRRYLVR